MLATYVADRAVSGTLVGVWATSPVRKAAGTDGIGKVVVRLFEAFDHQQRQQKVIYTKICTHLLPLRVHPPAGGRPRTTG